MGRNINAKRQVLKILSEANEPMTTEQVWDFITLRYKPTKQQLAVILDSMPKVLKCEESAISLRSAPLALWRLKDA